MIENALPVGKLPMELLGRLLNQTEITDERVLVGPGIGMDCAVLDLGEKLLVLKSDPITFATDEIGWYAVQINANDLATTGATPRWMMVTVLLPEGKTDEALILEINDQLQGACAKLGITVIGGHTEVTYGIDRPILSSTLIGEVEREKLITPRGAAPGDHMLLTKGVPIEATAILAREFPEKLVDVLSAEEIEEAANFLHNPGIGVTRDARIALAVGQVTAMHDPTEGGLAGALWELADACGHAILVEPESVHVPELSAKVCQAFGLDPLATIASGALLLAVRGEDAEKVRIALQENHIPCTQIGVIEAGEAGLWQLLNGERSFWPRPVRDEIGKVYET
jgi:hydrogenase expression/formation protein HypE